MVNNTPKTLARVVDGYNARLMHQGLKASTGLESVGAVVAGVNTVVDAAKTIKRYADEHSLTTYTETANLEPRVMLEESLRLHPSMDKFMMTLVNIYSAYYLQAIALTTTISGVSAVGILGQFNPNRKPDLANVVQSIIAKTAVESAIQTDYVLPKYGKVPKHKPVHYSQEVLQLISQRTSIESDVLNNVQPQNQGKQKTAPPAKRELSFGLKQIEESNNLAVGRILDVALTMNNQTVHVPVAVRMRPMSVPQLIMTELVALGDIKESWGERWHRMRAGELSVISDWIFQSDVIKKKRKLLLLDKDGLYSDMIKRRKNNKLAALATGQASLGAASSFMVITPETVRAAEARTGLSIKNLETRNLVFAENSAMMIIVVDVDWEQVTCYTRGVDVPAVYTFKQFEGMSKGNGIDITDVMKAFQAGNNPRF